MAVFYLPADIFFEVAAEIASSAEVCVDVVREAPKWLVLQGDPIAVEKATTCCQTRIGRQQGVHNLSGRIVRTPSCRGDTSHVKLTSSYIHTALVQLQSDIAPWVDENIINAAMCALQVTPAHCSIHKGNERATATISINHTDAAKLDKLQLAMPWGSRHVRFSFSLCDDAGAKGSTNGQSRLHREPAVDSGAGTPLSDNGESLGLAPLPSARQFVKMASEEKRNTLEYAFQERLLLQDQEVIASAAADIVDKHRGDENHLYDMISEIGAQAVYDMCNVSDVSMTGSPPHDASDITVNDIIEVGPSRGEGVYDGSLVVKVRKIDREGGSLHVDGSLLSLTGKELKLCDMFTAPAVIKTRSARGYDNLVLSHPAAKIAYERPSGTHWFTCRKDTTKQWSGRRRLRLYGKNVPRNDHQILRRETLS